MSQEPAVIAPARLPDLRSEVIADLARPGPNAARDTYALHVRRGTQLLADPGERDPGRQAQLLVRSELRRLRDAELYWVSPEMTRLCLAAAPGMPAFYPRRADLPARCGLICFAVPLASYQPDLEITYADASTFRSPAAGTQAPAGPRSYQMTAATWGPWDNAGRWRPGGTWFTFYTAPGPGGWAADLAATGLGEAEAQRLAGQMPWLRIDNEAACPASPADHPPGEPPLAEAVRDTASTSWWMHLVLCAFRLMETARAARVTQQPAGRPARKRAARAQVTRPGQPVRLIDVTAGHVRRDSAPAGQQASREYRMRWLVSGHWRNQYYPSRDTRLPRWIDGYVKGPAGAPLKIAETVRVFRQHPAAPPPGEGS